jgi:predicted DCC family thiol-disulfide oxidoreductase YuxK
MDLGNNYLILFDGVCNFCNSSVNFIIDRDSKSKFKFASLQSEIGQQYLVKFKLNAINFDSIILIHESRFFQKSSAALLIAKELDGSWALFYYLFIWIPAFVRDFFYDLIAKNRYKIFGKLDACRLPNAAMKDRFL